ncbi:MAG: hypothetical protein U9Q30_03695, partial [Campylobacterota bacterium]|nr:hypothetical protein [Campylobacterota bacterium]
NIKDINQRYKLLVDTLEDIDIFNEYKAVANILKIKNIPILDINRDEVLSEIQNSSPSFLSIDKAIKSLTQNIDKSNIYISSIKQNNISETTQFSKILKDSMVDELNSTKYSSNADYFLTGEYEVLENSIFIISKLKDINNTTIKTDVIKLDKSAYQDINYTTSILDFDKTINNQYIKSNNLFVKIGLKGFNRFKEIDLNSDDKINILVNSNKPICYFIVGHSLKENKKFSYTIGDIRVLETSDINRDILLYEDIPVSKPYGVEVLQIFASDLKQDGSCSLVYPSCTDTYEGYCVIDGKPASVVSNIRGLNLPYKKDNIEKVENSIIFTSFEKIK